MSDQLRDFEREALTTLLAGVFRDDVIRRIIDEGDFVSCDFSGAGYFVTLRHDLAPKNHRICGEATVNGRADGYLAGFLAILMDGEVTLECYSLEADSFPDDFRDRVVRLSSE